MHAFIYKHYRPSRYEGALSLVIGLEAWSQSIEERLERRLGRLHARLRLGIEADHEAQVFGHGINYFHIGESSSIAHRHSNVP